MFEHVCVRRYNVYMYMCCVFVYSHVHVHVHVYIQVNEKFNKLERRYRDCIKKTRDKTRTYMIQALYYDIFCNKLIIRACIMESEIPYFLVLSLSSSAWCIMQYTVCPCLVSCIF